MKRYKETMFGEYRKKHPAKKGGGGKGGDELLNVRWVSRHLRVKLIDMTQK
jgi:hypothetical protein